jgi:hypothetical protein
VSKGPRATIFERSSESHTRRSGGIGRRASLRGWCPQGRGGSSPPSDTHLSTRVRPGLNVQFTGVGMVGEAQSHGGVHGRFLGRAGARESDQTPLWAVSISGIPAAPIAAAGLLGWTIMITGNQLDSPGPFSNIWKGVIQRAEGR